MSNGSSAGRGEFTGSIRSKIGKGQKYIEVMDTRGLCAYYFYSAHVPE